MTGAIIIAGDELCVDAPVRTWKDTGLQFIAARDRRCRRRFIRPDSIMWHWTAGEGGGEQIYQTLRARGLGVEFAIDREGIVYQYADPATTDARDCGSAWDRRSMGCEIACYGMRRPYTRPWDLLGTPPKARDREVVEARSRGRRVYVAAFYPSQVRSALALGDALRLAFGIPPRLPRGDDGRVLDRRMTREEERDWAGGELGHLHVSDKGKQDPGTWWLERVEAHHLELAAAALR